MKNSPDIFLKELGLIWLRGLFMIVWVAGAITVHAWLLTKTTTFSIPRPFPKKSKQSLQFFPLQGRGRETNYHPLALSSIFPWLALDIYPRLGGSKWHDTNSTDKLEGDDALIWPPSLDHLSSRTEGRAVTNCTILAPVKRWKGEDLLVIRCGNHRQLHHVFVS